MRITGGSARGVPLVVPRSRGVRPTSDRVRGALFQLLGAAIADARVLDLYAGSGALGIEALSRGAAFVDFVEADSRLCSAVARNLKAADFTERGRVYHARVERSLEFLNGPYQLLLLDPPYALSDTEQTISRLAVSDLIDNEATMAVEHSSRVPLADGYGPLRRLQARRYGDTAVSIYTTREA